MGRRVLLLGAVAIGCAGFAGLFAMPASAALVRLADGKVIGYQPMIGQTSKAPSRFDIAFSNLDYSGGPVMPSNVNYTIVWRPSNYSATPFQSDATPSHGYVFGVNQYLQDLAHDSGGHANADSVSVQYNDASGNRAEYNAQFGGSFTDTDPLPSNGCPAFSGDICITDAQIQAELDSFLAAHSLPRDMTHEYYLLTPPDVGSCFDAAGDACSANADLSQAYCAYHSASATSSSFIYSNIPDLTGNGGCDPFTIDGLDPPNSFADGVLSSLAHEHNESTTDPQPNNAWTDWQAGCTGNDETCGGEIGDKCGFYELNDPNTVTNNGTAFNQVINGRKYWLQPEWSNQTPSGKPGQAGHCLDGWTSNGHTAHAAFTQSPGAGTNTVSFDASASSGSGGVKEYVWQFNDDVTPGQTPQRFTFETTSPTVTHTFPKAGNYTVALTVMTSDGTSNAAAHDVTAGASLPPTASFAFSPGSPLEGTAVSFDAGGSSDPNPGGSIESYSWDFGDGGGAGGARPSHTYARAGAYHVTLTVTGSENKTAHVTHDVIVTDEAPSAAFTPASGMLAGSAVSFDGRASSDPDGSIRIYSWSFGDGGTGSGATASHTYGTAGTYVVTLTVLDTDGHSAGVSHPIVIGSSGGGARCTVPQLRHKTLNKTRGLLRGAGCALGRVTKPRHKPRRGAGRHKVWKLLVVRQSPRTRQTGPVGEPVAVTLRWVAVRR